MPVDLSLIPEKKSLPQPPKVLVWLLLLFLAVACGLALTIFLFPPEGNERSLVFWGQAIFLPTLLWLMAFFIRFHFYDRNVKYAQSWNKHHEHRRGELIAFARRPLRLISQSIVTGAGSFGHAAAITSGLLKIASTPPINGGVPIPHTSIAKDSSFGSSMELLPHLFIRLKNGLNLPNMEALRDKKFNVKLMVECGLDREAVLNVWHRSWDDHLPKNAELEYLERAEVKEGVMQLDKWLDDTNNDDAYLLIVSVQLYADAIANSAEAAIAMLFAGHGVSVPDKPLPILVHRPVQGEIGPALGDALLWGKCDAKQIKGVWCSEGEFKYVTDMLITFYEEAQMTPDVYRINAALGDAGSAAGWLTLAIAVEQSQISSSPQLASYSGNSGVFMVVEPSSAA